MGRPHPPLRSGRGPSSAGIPKPEPGSHTLPRTEPAETVTVSEIWSSGESPAWRMLLVTSSLTTSRTSSSFSGGKRFASRSRAWRAVVTTSGSGASLTSISATIKKSQRIGQHCRRYLPSVRRRYTPHGRAAALLAKRGLFTLRWLRASAIADYLISLEPGDHQHLRVSMFLSTGRDMLPPCVVGVTRVCWKRTPARE